MSDDLVKRLRDKVEASRIYDDDEELLDETADRIEMLECRIEMTECEITSNATHLDAAMVSIEELEAALRSIADIEHEDLPKPTSAAEGTLWAVLDGCVVVAKRALEDSK